MKQIHAVAGRMAVILLLAGCSIGMIVMMGCRKQADVAGILKMSDRELEGSEISILWAGPEDAPMPSVIFVCNEQPFSPKVDWQRIATVYISKEEARGVLGVVAPILVRHGTSGKDESNELYVVKLKTVKRHIEASLGNDAKSQYAALTAIAEKLNEEGKAAMEPLIAVVSYVITGDEKK